MWSTNSETVAKLVQPFLPFLAPAILDPDNPSHERDATFRNADRSKSVGHKVA
jgi:hypothetical protein